jgi:hypothetical protein
MMHCGHINNVSTGMSIFYMWRMSQLGEIHRSMPCAHTDFICQSPALTTIMRHHTLMHLLLACTIIHAIVWYIVPYVMIKGARLDKVELSFPCFLVRGEREAQQKKNMKCWKVLPWFLGTFSCTFLAMSIFSQLKVLLHVRLSKTYFPLEIMSPYNDDSFESFKCHCPSLKTILHCFYQEIVQ